MFAGGRKARRQGKGRDAGSKGAGARRKAGALDTDALSLLIGAAPATVPGSTAAPAGVQAKSEGRPVEDPMEKEADAAAKRVAQASAEAAGKKKEALAERAREEEKKEKRTPRRKAEEPEREDVQAKADSSVGASAGGGHGGRQGEPLAARLESARGKGSPMDSGTRDLMESGFGADFGQVRIHTDQEAADMSREMRAQAFTLGHDVYFNASRYNPATEEGRRLLAHELAHVLQQKPAPEQERPASPES